MPHHIPHQLGEEPIAQTLGFARSTIGLVLRRLGLNRLALLGPRPAVVRYQRQRSGEMIHLDIKKLGKIRYRSPLRTTRTRHACQ